jgi:YgiT-type zinc finger domain-containing protein
MSQESFVEQRVNYTVQVGGRLVLVENVPARVCVETGEQLFSPDTVERLQRLIGSKARPSRVIETPVFAFA